LKVLAGPAWAKGVVRRIAEDLGVHPEDLRSWVKKAQIDGGLWPRNTTHPSATQARLPWDALYAVHHNLADAQ